MFKIFLMITAIISTSYAGKHDITVIDDNGNKKYFPTRKALGKWKDQETRRKYKQKFLKDLEPKTAPNSKSYEKSSEMEINSNNTNKEKLNVDSTSFRNAKDTKNFFENIKSKTGNDSSNFKSGEKNTDSTALLSKQHSAKKPTEEEKALKPSEMKASPWGTTIKWGKK